MVSMTLAASPEAPLETLSQASGRPAECSRGTGEGTSRWDRARLPGLGRHCDAIQRATARLSGDPEGAISLAREASVALAGRAAPLVVEARARLRLGAAQEAWAAFERARALDARSVEAPLALADYARAALRAAHQDDALRAYRDLAVRIELLGTDEARVRVLVEAGALAMSTGVERLPEAVGYLMEARGLSRAARSRDLASGALALALDRLGRADQARAVADEASGPWDLADPGPGPEGTRRADEPDLPEGERDAIIALLAETRDRELAAERWTSYLSHAGAAPAAYQKHARAHLAALSARRKAR